MATTIGRSLDEINKKTKELDNNIKSLTNENKLLDKSLKFDSKSLDTLNKRALNTEKSIDALQQRIALLREKQVQYDNQLKAGEITQTTYNKLATDITKAELQLKQLNSELEDTNKKIKNLPTEKFIDFGNKIQNAANKTRGLSIATAALLTGLIALGKSTASYGAEIDDFAQRAQVSAKVAQEWIYIANQTGVESEQLSKAIIKVRAAYTDLTVGEQNAQTEALALLGITAKQYNSVEDLFNATITKLSELGAGTEQTAIANEIFGDKIANNLIPLLNAGTEELSKFKEEFSGFDTLTDEQVAALAKTDDSFYRMQESVKNAGYQLGASLAPILENLAEFIENNVVPAIQSITEWFDNLSPEMQNVIIGGLGLLAVLSPILTIIGKISKSAGGLINILKRIKDGGWQAAAGIGALVGVLTLSLDLIGNWKEMSTVEKILKTLAIAALAAAAAVTVFHASWSLGIAVGVISAAVVAGLAAINSAKNSILPETEDFSAENIESSFGNYTPSSEDVAGVTGGSSYTDNRINNIELNVYASEGMDTNELSDEIIDKLKSELAINVQVRR